MLFQQLPSWRRRIGGLAESKRGACLTRFPTSEALSTPVFLVAETRTDALVAVLTAIGYDVLVSDGAVDAAAAAGENGFDIAALAAGELVNAEA